MNKTITLRGPFEAYPTVEAMANLGYVTFAAKPITVYRVEKTMNTLVVLPGKLLGSMHAIGLTEDSNYDVHVLTSKDGEGAYVTADRWIELGGRRGDV